MMPLRERAGLPAAVLFYLKDKIINMDRIDETNCLFLPLLFMSIFTFALGQGHVDMVSGD